MENAIFQKWMKSPNVSTEMKDAMKKMSKNDIESSFSDEPLKFGTAGYRAIYGPGPLFLNEYTYQQLTVGYAKFLLRRFEEKSPKERNKRCRVLIAHDNRATGKEISVLVGNILSSFGIEVYYPNNNASIATPMVSFLIREYGFDGAVNITASHNPKEYNGFKAYNDKGAQVTVEEAELISNLLPDTYENLTRTYTPNIKLIYFLSKSWLPKYFDSIKETLVRSKPKNKEPIVITTHHGVASNFAEDFLKSLGHNIHSVPSQCFEDGNFINSPIMNPEDNESFNEAIKYAEEIKSKLILGFDPDADRIAVAVKSKGTWRFLNGNETGILLTFYLVNTRNFQNKVPILISTYVSNTLVNRIMASKNGLVLRTATGFKNIAAAMEHIESDKSEYVLGFEEAIGVNTSLRTREKDAFAAAALILEMVDFYKAQNYDLVEILEKRIYLIYGYCICETRAIKITGANWKSKARSLEKKALSITPNKTKINGFNIKEVFWNSTGECIEWVLDNGSWIKFRISGTEPKFKIYFNLFSNNKVSGDKKKEIINKLTKSVKARLGL